MAKAHNHYCMSLFSALANPVRIAILQTLLRGEKTVNQLAAGIGQERTLVSHNLAALQKVELVTFKKRGKERIYCANEKIAAPLFMLIEKFVCTRCSFRATCLALRQKKLSQTPTAMNRLPCKNC